MSPVAMRTAPALALAGAALERLSAGVAAPGLGPTGAGTGVRGPSTHGSDQPSPRPLMVHSYVSIVLSQKWGGEVSLMQQRYTHASSSATHVLCWDDFSLCDVSPEPAKSPSNGPDRARSAGPLAP